MSVSELRRPKTLGIKSVEVGESKVFHKTEEWSPIALLVADEWSNIHDTITRTKVRHFKHETVDDIFYGQPPILTREGKFYIDERISNIYQTIVDSYSLSQFKDDWDEEDAIGFNELVHDRAITILAKYAEFMINSFDISIPSPEINLGRDGSIDLEWRVNKNILLINILNTKDLKAHFYGHDISTDTILKGTFVNFNINQVLTYWMKCLV